MHKETLKCAGDFIDRDEYVTQYKSELTKRQSTDKDAPDAYRILGLWGKGGCGKTKLLEEFRRQIELSQDSGPKTALSIIDFQYPCYRDPLAAMLKLRYDMSRHISFRTFDLAFGKLYLLDNPGSGAQEAQRILDAHGGESTLLKFFISKTADVINTGFDVASNFNPIFTMGSLVFKWGGELLDYVGDQIKPVIKAWLDDPQVKAICNEIDATRSASVLRQNLPSYFGFDLRRAMSKKDSPRIVLMFDHHHTLFTHRSSSAFMADLWIRNLIKASPGSLVVIFSRHELCWDTNEDSFWQPPNLVQKELEPFDENYSKEYLVSREIEDPAIQARIIKAAGGVPFNLALSAQRYSDINITGRKPTVDEFGTTPAEVVDNFIDHLPLSEHSNLRLASYPETLDEELFLDLVDAFPGHICADWGLLTSHSFMQDDGNGNFAMRPTIRDNLQQGDKTRRSKHFNNVHKWLLERYEGIIESANSPSDISALHDQALILAVKHLSKSDPTSLPTWMLDKSKDILHNFFEAHRWQALSEVYEIANNITPAPNPEDKGRLEYHYASILQWSGNYAKSKPLFESALRLHKENFPDNTAERATLYHALADVNHKLGENDQSEKLYLNALERYNKDTSKFKQRRVDALFSIGLFHHAAGRISEAKKFYTHADELNQELNGLDSTPYAYFLVLLGKAYVTHKDYSKAEEILRKALDILVNREDDDPHQGEGPVLLELAECALQGKEYAEAELLFNRAVSIFKEYAGESHPNYGHALHRQASFWIKDKYRIADAVNQLQRAVAIISPAMGENHDWTKQALMDFNTAKSLLS